MKSRKRSGATDQEVATFDARVFINLPEGATAVSLEASAARTQLLQSVRDANASCIDMLVHAARIEPRDRFPLVNHLRSLLPQLTPDVRGRAADTPLLLVDMQLRDAEWWTHLQEYPNRPPPVPPGRGNFSRAGAVPLGRATLMLAWHGVRSDPVGCCLLGIAPEVARIIASFSLTELDRAVERRFRYVRPRWEDRPAVWRALLVAAQTDDARRIREVNLRAIQLMTGDLLATRGPLH